MTQHHANNYPVIIVGTGPVGIAVASELTRLDPDQKILMFGGEPWHPYDRIQLSSLVAGDARVADLDYRQGFESGKNVIQYQNRWVQSVDAASKVVKDWKGQVHRYTDLVLATGSSPLMPDIPGIDLPGVFTFRNMDDAMRLMARQTRSRRTVVIGGGLLGLEAAKAMQRHNTQVWVVERSDRLMPQQLDIDAADFLRENILEEGIQVSMNATVAAIEGRDKVERVWLEDGSELYCDTVIVAAGIRPNTELASEAGLYVNRGICIGDDVRTSDPNIFAVGECAEHNGIVYGLVAPGLEQAAVAAQEIHGQSASYVGTVAATKLKVFDTDVYSLGDVQFLDNGERQYVWRSSKDRIYRKLVVRDERAVGVVSIGDWPALPRVQDFVNQRRRVTRKHVECFQRTGYIWSPEGQPEVIHWPSTATVCNCIGVTRGELGLAMKQGCDTVAALADVTRASTVCGSCKPLLAELIGMEAQREPARGYRPVLMASAITLLALLLAAIFAPIPYAESFNISIRWDELWRNSLFKQVSGYSVLGLSVVGLVMSLRKRVPRFSLGSFPVWRVLHVLLAAIALAALLVHTGGRLGNHLNFYLMLAFIGLLASGAVLGTVTSMEHRMIPVWAKRIRSQATWLHVLVFWPLPVLLGFHILKTYYF